MSLRRYQGLAEESKSPALNFRNHRRSLLRLESNGFWIFPSQGANGKVPKGSLWLLLRAAGEAFTAEQQEAVTNAASADGMDEAAFLAMMEDRYPPPPSQSFYRLYYRFKGI